MSDTGDHRPPSTLSAGILGRCPRCGVGSLFAGFLKPAAACSRCGLDLGFADAGDGPAVFVIFIVGFVGVVGVFVTEFVIGAPLWLNLGLWMPAIVVLSLGLLRPLKGLLIVQQYAKRAAEGRLFDE